MRTAQRGESAGPHGTRRSDVLAALSQADGPVGIDHLAGRLRVHPNTVRFHLNRLIDAGRVVKTEPARGATGRPAGLYRIAPGMDPEGPRRYRQLAQVLLDGLGTGPAARKRALNAGRAWGLRSAGGSATAPDAAAPDPAATVAGLVALLDEAGFDPVVIAGDEPDNGTDEDREPNDELPRIDLRHCPFLELATEEPPDRAALVCAIHLGLMEGALEAWESGVTVERLVPFAEPDRCVTQLRARLAS